MAREHKRRFEKIRRQSGASIALVLVCVFLIAVIIAACFNFGMVMGGSQQVRNAVDASVLNVSKEIVQSKVPTQSGFEDCADTSGMVGVSNISRVWGKAMLINANAEEMVREGSAGQNTSGMADTSYGVANNINSSLVSKVEDRTTLNSYYRHMANTRFAGLLGFGGPSLQRADDEPFDFAMVGRGGDSNLKFGQDQFPPSVSVQGNCSSCMPGYQSMTVNGREFMLPTFPAGQMPKLLADGAFQAARPEAMPLGGGPAAIPNAFASTGYVDGSRASIRASAAALANPQRQYVLAIPKAYVRLRYTNSAKWIIKDGNDKEKLFKTTKYEMTPKVYHEVKQYKLKSGGKLDVWATLGVEYASPGLLQVLKAIPGDYQPALKKMAQRLREVDKDFTQSRLEALMDSVQIDDDADYLIYPDYSTPDFTSPVIKIGKENSKSLPQWLKTAASADGLDKALVQTPVYTDQPNTCHAERTEFSSSYVKYYTKVKGTINWQPGTGYTQCLGEMVSQTQTEVHAEVPP
ncbi:MAG: hypothetical protein KC777_18375 [Cyanobacteria bacterium HKST-UBA02]|nr:hypothetical protein [Cyanobacteria bacterium HKST-UBA02]